MASKKLKTFFNKYSEILITLRDQVSKCCNDDSGKPEEDMNAFWGHIELCMKCLSQETTKLSLACSEPPLPSCEDLLQVMQSIEKASVTLASACLGFSGRCHGMNLKTTLADNVKDILDGLVELLNNLSDDSTKNRKKYLQSTGTVWNVSDKFSSMPKDNKEAVLHKMKQMLSLLKDACDEFNEVFKENAVDGNGHDCDVIDDMEDDFLMKWRSCDLEMVISAFGLVKTSKACLAKVLKSIEINGNTKESLELSLNRLSLDGASQLDELGSNIGNDQVQQLDAVCLAASKISPAVDDLVSCLYPPITETETIENYVKRLSDVLKNFINTARSSHFILAVDVSWVEFLLKAIHHDAEKFRNSLQ